MVAALVMLGGGQQRSYRVLVPGLGRLTGERQQASLVPGLPPQVLGVPTSPLLGATLLVAAAARLLPWRRAPRRSPTLVQFPPDAALEDERTKTEARRVLALLADDAAQQEPQELREAALALALLDFSRSAPSLSGAARLRTLKAAAQPLSVAKSLRKASTSGSRATKSTRTGSTLEEYSKLEAARDAVAGALLLAAGILADGFALEEEAAALRRLFNMPLEAERSERLRVSSARTAVRAELRRLLGPDTAERVTPEVVAELRPILRRAPAELCVPADELRSAALDDVRTHCRSLLEGGLRAFVEARRLAGLVELASLSQGEAAEVAEAADAELARAFARADLAAELALAAVGVGVDGADDVEVAAELAALADGVPAAGLTSKARQELYSGFLAALVQGAAGPDPRRRCTLLALRRLLAVLPTVATRVAVEAFEEASVLSLQRGDGTAPAWLAAELDVGAADAAAATEAALDRAAAAL